MSEKSGIGSNQKEWTTVLVAATFYCAGASIFYAMPVYLGDVARNFGVSTASLGTISAVELWAMAIASLTGPLWITRFDWRQLAYFGAVASFIGQVASLFAGSFAVLVAIRAMTGLLGEGLLMAVAYTLLGQTRHFERSFGWVYGSSIAVSMTMLYAAPTIDKAFGSIGILAMLAFLAALAIAGAPLVPNKKGFQSRSDVGKTSGVTSLQWLVPACLLLSSEGLLFAGSAGFWSFTEQIAAGNGVSASQVAPAIGLGTAAGLLGSLFAMVLGDRLGRLTPTAVCLGVMTFSVMGFTSVSTFIGIAVELAIFNFAWTLATIYISAIVCSSDEDGKITVVLSAFQTIGMAFGSFLLGNSINLYGMNSVTWLVGLLFLATFVLLIFGMRQATAGKAAP